MGFVEILSKLFGNKSQRDLREIMPYVDKIKAVYPEIARLDNDALRARTETLKQRIADAVAADKARIKELKDSVEALDIDKREKVYREVDKLEKDVTDTYEKVLLEVLPEAFAIVKDTARRFSENHTVEVTASQFDRDLAARYDFVHIEGDKAIYQNHWTAGGNEVTWDMVHYDVQLIGGVVLHQGKIAEMATGEGKTLVATLPVFLNALTHEGVHVVTVNDYLAKRDSEWMGPLYMFHGLSVDCIDKYRPNSDERRRAYACDITFGTNNEFGFDYLRDNMATSPLDLVQRKHNYAIVDEVDSVLIDDARTPLIISGPVPKGEVQLFDEYKHRVELLVRTQQTLTTKLLAEARQKMASEDKKVAEEGELALFRSYKGMPKNKALIKFLSEQGNKVRLQKTEEFYMQENNKNMHIATDELYFVIDEKNKSIELTDKGIDALTGATDDSTFFVLPDVGSEVAEIEKLPLNAEEKQQKKDEVLEQYSIKSERVHTVNQLLKAYTLFEKDVDYVIMDGEVKIVDEQTGRIMEGRRWSDGLHQAVEAKENVKVEAATQTFATITLQNYFRMYHKLAGMTGTAETEAGEFWNIYKLDVVVIPTNRPIARLDMNDRVYRTKREKYNAVIEEIVQLHNEGRPVLVGTTSVEISELLSRMLNIRKISHNVLNAKLHQREADIVAEAGRTGTVTIATNMAGRGTDIKLTTDVKEAGGLAIIGTERHESRRVDRQLRGRAGRQGDPGSSVFYVSLEDDLMRMFGSERIAGLMDKMGFEEGEMIEHKMISNSIERAQKKVEENNFGIRKRLLEYDDVMNQQRNVIYAKRHHALMGERLGVDITNMIYDTAEAIVTEHHDVLDYEGLSFDIMQVFAMEVPFDEEEFRAHKPDRLTEQVATAAIETFKRKMDKLAQVAYPVIKNIYETKGSQYENILIPVTDGKRVYNIATNLKAAYETECKEVIKEFEKRTLLYVIDDEWKEHLRQLDDLKQSVQNASYEQKDPLLIYKLESFNLFSSMLNNFNRRAIAILLRGQIPVREPQEVRQAQTQQRQDYSKYRTQKDLAGARPANDAAHRDTREMQKPEPLRVEKKVGRNDPCPCGSGKKYKNCHGKEQ
ncbi:MAG: preprotein translocase subunit SecA [Paludibacter sp.]|nr:preprotein translocase subunit SecA [Bacteroidales bacterium]MCM1069877.1 preprotein translocase subunit SecA [Prevotella sp.]MCM1353050.1 preprotein translocase subunit SecA [Bacteroides sp.]MCM1443407.1 preprotein translocase subunit SecA [Muribaculum sp.]MCM1481215.1 preprotein translocase subunit SecA [Paludibacter sp.]